MNEADWKLAQYFAEDEAFIQVAILVKYGFDYDVAMSLPEVQRFAYVVVFKSMYENLVFLWDQKKWIVRPETKIVAGKI